MVAWALCSGQLLLSASTVCKIPLLWGVIPRWQHYFVGIERLRRWGLARGHRQEGCVLCGYLLPLTSPTFLSLFPSTPLPYLSSSLLYLFPSPPPCSFLFLSPSLFTSLSPIFIPLFSLLFYLPFVCFSFFWFHAVKNHHLHSCTKINRKHWTL